MNLRGRIERLEAAAVLNEDALPGIVIKFVEPVRSEDDQNLRGRITGGLRILPDGGRQWLDADMKPV